VVVVWLLFSLVEESTGPQTENRSCPNSRKLSVTVGLFGIGLIYDFWTLNSQVSELNLSQQAN